MSHRCEVYKVISGRKELWDEYCRLRTKVKEAVREKLSIWNEVVEKVTVDFEGSRKTFWPFVGRRTNKYKNITSLKSKAVLDKVSVDDNFEADWNEEVASTLGIYSRGQKKVNVPFPCNGTLRFVSFSFRLRLLETLTCVFASSFRRNYRFSVSVLSFCARP